VPLLVVQCLHANSSCVVVHSDALIMTLILDADTCSVSAPPFGSLCFYSFATETTVATCQPLVSCHVSPISHAELAALNVAHTGSGAAGWGCPLYRASMPAQNPEKWWWTSDEKETEQRADSFRYTEMAR